jgi:hypothetical protein
MLSWITTLKLVGELAKPITRRTIMWKKIVLIATLLIFVAGGNALAFLTSGDHSQQSSAFVDNAVVKRGIVRDGSQAVADQSTSGSYRTTFAGIGVSAGLGISAATTTNTTRVASSVALAANLSASAILGADSLATLSGAGQASTVAVKDFQNASGSASTFGNFAYSGEVANGAMIGAGITGGFSSVTTTTNSVVSIAGHGTVSGIVSIGGSVPE